MKYLALTILVLLAGCVQTDVQEVLSKPVVTSVSKEVQPPEHLNSELKARDNQQLITVLPETTPIQEEKSCISNCEDECEQSAQNACKASSRSECKSNCGDIIDTSACSQACSFISQSGSCRAQFAQFCSAKCIEICH